MELLAAINEKENTLKQTDRNDLESFFYVVIVGCLSYGCKTASDHLYHWSEANTIACPNAKENYIIIRFQSKIIDYFTPVFERVQDLAWGLREILFEDKSVGYGTPEVPNVLDDTVIRVLDDTIKKLEGEKVFN
ncbi:BgTH12-03112 [Blumeria graminis f. sp. triticale]|uniref:BgTH12-03112 n=1 Tax=Blumeria graminis f. sp. triticale TaxID=1689686 RepID=A0A9W4D344_BLUGR|nr:BgTH12-03112 [Blumeria graminis f. sp. triticale]